MSSLQRPLFIGCVLTAVPMLLLDLPTGDSFPWFKQLAEYFVAPGRLVISAIMYGKLYGSSYYYAAFLNIAFYTVIAFIAAKLWRRFSRGSGKPDGSGIAPGSSNSR